MCTVYLSFCLSLTSTKGTNVQCNIALHSAYMDQFYLAQKAIGPGFASLC